MAKYELLCIEHIGDTKEGMAYPLKEMAKDVKIFASLFEDFHKDSLDGLSRGYGVVEELTNVIEKNFPQYDRKLIRRYALSRTCFRMRAIGKVIYPKYYTHWACKV